MKLQDIAVALYEAIEDGKQCGVEVQPITTIRGDRKYYYLRIEDKRYRVSEKVALNAMKWRVPVTTLTKQYKLGNILII
jgi:hypothetical protein